MGRYVYVQRTGSTVADRKRRGGREGEGGREGGRKDPGEVVHGMESRLTCVVVSGRLLQLVLLL